jgi:hypothetical protein
VFLCLFVRENEREEKGARKGCRDGRRDEGRDGGRIQAGPSITIRGRKQDHRRGD